MTVALVTGACSGIGLAFAQQLALRKDEVILVSHRPEALERAASELRARAPFPVKLHVVVVDLAAADAPARLLTALTERGLEPELFVSNAGVLHFGEAVDYDAVAAQRLLQLHVVTPSLLCSHFGKAMRARRRGHILVVSSLIAYRDFPGLAHYGASKRYLLDFAMALRSELGVYGVVVSCVAPGATLTPLYSHTQTPVELGKKLGVMMPPEQVAREALEALFANRAVCLPGRLNPWLAQVLPKVPQGVIDWVRRRAPWLPRVEPK